MKTLSLRGIDEELAENLKKTAKKTGTSLNKTVLEILRKSVGAKSKKREVVYHDLDDLAGTWAESDWEQFKKAAKPFGAIDKDMWK
jgi:plasmid stability protein